MDFTTKISVGAGRRTSALLVRPEIQGRLKFPCAASPLWWYTIECKHKEIHFAGGKHFAEVNTFCRRKQFDIRILLVCQQQLWQLLFDKK
jgi:hypothetical protein